MKVPLSWINEFVDINTIKVETLINKLTLSGFEVEEILDLTINNKKEIILDLSTTANRPDSLSILGLSNEIGAILNKPVAKQIPSSFFSDNKLLPKVDNFSDQNNICSDFIVSNIDISPIKKIPNWLLNKLICCGFEPKHNIYDLIDFVLLETGYPFELYDSTIILENSTINNFDNDNCDFIIKTIKSETEITINNNKIFIENGLDLPGLYINNVLVSVVGLKNLDTFQVTNKTQKILIEGSIFNSKSIRQLSRKVGFKTERSTRYEKGINNSELLIAYDRLLELITSITTINQFTLCTSFITKIDNSKKIILKLNHIHEVLGLIKINEVESTYLDSKTISNYLIRLNCEINEISDSKFVGWEVKVPLSRISDLTQEIDLIEEIGRLHGYNNFVTKLPEITDIGQSDTSYNFRKKLTTCFVNMGFNELLNYSLISSVELNNITVTNALTNEYSTLRDSLLYKLIENYSYNIKQKNFQFNGFEYGHIFNHNKLNNYIEQEVVSGIFGTTKQQYDWETKAVDFSWVQAKGKIEILLDKIDIQVNWEPLTDSDSKYLKILHPFRSANLIDKTSNKLIGVFGQINLFLAKEKNINSNVFLFEFNFDQLCNSENFINLPAYQAYSVYPKITKDISFIINKTVSYKTIHDFILKNTNSLLINIELIDQYNDETNFNETISICLKLTFQSKLRTLKTNEIENILTNLKPQLNKQFNTVFRV